MSVLCAPGAADASGTFEALLTPLLTSAHRSALRLTRHPEDAENLVQEAAMKALAGFSTFRAGSNFRAWFFRIMLNAFAQAYHRERRRPLVLVESDGELDRLAPGADGDPLRGALALFDLEEIARAFRGVPEIYRTPTALALLRELSYEEIAARLGCPVGTVRSRIHRGRKLLQEALAPLAREEGLGA